MTAANKLVEVYKLATQLIAEHGLDGWRFNLSNHKVTVGECNHSKKTISYSVHFIKQTPLDGIRDTILHEIAHAIAGPTHGHDPFWKAICVSIGAKPERLDNEAVTTANYNYEIVCPNCGRNWYRYRLRQSIYGARCPSCKIELEIYALK